jgi:hypothetical protein
LGFLSALGALITLTDTWPDRDIRLGWVRRLGWRPLLRVSPPCERDELVRALHVELSRHADGPEFTRLGKDISVDPETFRSFVLDASEKATAGDRRQAEFAAAYGSELVLLRNKKVRPTPFKAQAGQQGFLKQVHKLAHHTAEHHLRAALFEPWRYADDGHDLPDRREPSMRWDPVDDRRYALRPDNPAESRIRSVRGANRLAVEGLRFFITIPAHGVLATIPAHGVLATVGFGTSTGSASQRQLLRWPIWSGFAGVSVVGSLLVHADLWAEPLDRDGLARMGVHDVMQSHRLAVEGYGNFSAAQPLLAAST